MLTIQDTELMQLMHEQKSPSWLNQKNQLATAELTFTSCFFSPATFSLIAITLGPLI